MRFAFADFRHAARQLVARPGFALFSILSLAIGVGAETTLFSAVNTYLFAGVQGVGAPQELVEIDGTRRGSDFVSFSYPDFRDYADRIKPSAALFAYRLEAVNLTANGEPQRGLSTLVSGNYFDALQVTPYRGRLLNPNDDRIDSGTPVAVATYAAWRKYLNADDGAIGKPVLINGRAFTLIGVTAPTFHGLIGFFSPEFYLPLSQRSLLQPGMAQDLTNPNARWLSIGARLTPEVTPARLEQELSAIVTQLAADSGTSKDNPGVRLSPLRSMPAEFHGSLLAFSGFLFALISMILLVACVNVAGMMLARGEGRRFEIAVRFALGASRGRIISQLLAESALLAVAAGIVGVTLSLWWCRLLERIDPPTPVPVLLQIPVSSMVLLFALGCVIATTIGFGLLPALRASSRAPGAGEVLVGRQEAGRRSRVGAALVVAQIALTLVLLVTGGLFLHAMQRAAAIDLGFDAQNVLVADFNLRPSGYEDSHQLRLQQSLLEQARALPGVQQAGLAAVTPLSLDRMQMGSFQVAGARDDELSPDVNLISPGYFAALTIRMSGRDFDTHDAKGSSDVGIVNTSLAHRLAADGNVLGHTFRYGDGKDMRQLTVIGIAEDGRYASLSDVNQPFLFLPLAQWPHAETSLVVKTDLPASSFALELNGAVRSLDASQPAGQVRPLGDLIALSLLPQRIAGLMSLALGTLGLLLAVIGLYGLITMHIVSRTREFGVRLALGASPGRILREVMQRGARLLVLGLAIGTLLSFGCEQLISSLLFGAGVGDVSVFAFSAIGLAAAALLACWLPARNAARTAPMEALRHE
ncbi:MAG: ABC transporter permease [Dokdonella sp.]|uniref:ABC transporter permease n=1 Tax=Dokdonella sp. TaxID=2291710 RepID=UPI0032669E3D